MLYVETVYKYLAFKRINLFPKVQYSHNYGYLHFVSKFDVNIFCLGHISYISMSEEIIFTQSAVIYYGF